MNDGPSARSVLLAQVRALRDQLNEAERTVQDQSLDQGLLGRIGVAFENLIHEERQKLEQLREQVEQDIDLQICWDTLSERTRTSAGIFQECLAFVQGALVRAAKLDGGLCELADALLDGLCDRTDVPWQRFTILADGEFHGEMVDIIRVRFPELDIWSLPVTAHEFGHFIAHRISDPAQGDFRYPVRELVDSEARRGPRDGDYAHEYFADLYATYALGPAFACACILLRFNPRTAYDDGAVHPSAAKRVYVMLRVLDKMNEMARTRRSAPYDEVLDDLRGVWARSLEGTGRPAKLEPAEIAELDLLSGKIFALLDRKLSTVRYGGWDVAMDWIEHWEDELRGRKPLSIPRSISSGTLRDALNAAWFCRLHHSEEMSRIGQVATELCHRIAGTRQ